MSLCHSVQLPALLEGCLCYPIFLWTYAGENDDEDDDGDDNDNEDNKNNDDNNENNKHNKKSWI